MNRVQMKTMYYLKHSLIFILTMLFLFGCASQPKVNLAPDYKYAYPDEPELVKIEQEIERFYNADQKKVILPYFNLIAKFNDLDDESFCKEDSIKDIDKAIELNPTSLFAHMLRMNCSEDALLIEKSTIMLERVNRILLSRKNGESPTMAIPVREISEADIILGFAGYDSFDTEIILNGERFIYKFYSIDNETGLIDVRYFDNFRMLRGLFGNYSRLLSNKDIRETMFSQFESSKNEYYLLFNARKALENKQYDKVTALLEPVKNESSVAKVVLAHAYLAENKSEKLDAILDDLFDLSSKRLNEATLLIAQLFLNNDNTASGKESIVGLLDNIDTGSEQGEGAYQFAKYLMKKDYPGDVVVEWFKVAAEKDHLYALRILGNAYYDGEIVEKDFKTSFDYFFKGHAIGDDYSTAQVGYMYDVGKGVEQNYELAFYYYKLLKNSGLGWVYNNLAIMYQHGHHVAIDEKESLRWNLLAAEAGNARGMNSLGLAYEKGRLIKQDYSEALKWFVKAAKLDYSYGAYNAGRFFEKGIGIESDLGKAIEYFELAIRLGSTAAYGKLGDIYWKSGENHNLSLAIENYQKGVEAKDGYSAYSLGYYEEYVNKNIDNAMEHYLRAAELGSNSALNHLGDIYYNGNRKGIEKDAVKANEFYLKAAEKGNSSSQVSLGYHLETGDGIEKNLEKAAFWYHKAADQNSAQGLNNIATFYLRGLGGVEKNIDKALEYYERSYSLGNDYAANNLGEMYYFGEGIEEDNEKAFQYFKVAVERGFRTSFFYLAECYRQGFGTEIDNKKAYELYLERAKEGDESSMKELAFMQIKGLGTPVNLKLGLQTLEKWAELKHKRFPDRNVNTMVAEKFFFGEDVPTDYKISMAYYEMAAEENDSTALNNLGEHYRWGFGVKKDMKKAMEYYHRAASLNDAAAMYNFGEIYRDGIGVPKDAKKGFEWMLKSADLGFISAYYELALMYKEGIGTKADQDKFKVYMQKAIEKKYKRAIDYRQKNPNSLN